MKKLFLLCCGFLIYAGISAQSASPAVIATSGDYFVNANVSMSWTLGEIVTETFSTGSVILTQGFQQSELIITSIEDLEENIDVKIYPNPTIELVNVQFAELQQDLRLDLIDATGKLIDSKQSLGENAINKFNLLRYPAGTYYLKFFDENSKNIKTFKIIKTNK